MKDVVREKNVVEGGDQRHAARVTVEDATTALLDAIAEAVRRGGSRDWIDQESCAP